MAAYVIADIEVTDPEGYEEYKLLVAASIEQYGGEYLVRGGKVQALEGDWSPHRFVMLRFESVEAARRWYDSPENARAKAIRHRTARSSIVLIEG